MLMVVTHTYNRFLYTTTKATKCRSYVQLSVFGANTNIKIVAFHTKMSVSNAIVRWQHHNVVYVPQGSTASNATNTLINLEVPLTADTPSRNCFLYLDIHSS